MKQHSDDYKLSAVMYYINHNEDLRVQIHMKI